MIEELRALLERYLAEGKYRTLNQVSTKSGVSYATVCRIAQKQTKTVELSTVLALLKIITPAAARVEFLKRHFPQVGDYFDVVSKHTGGAENIDESLEQALYDAERFVIVSLASTPFGCTKQDVTAVLGTGVDAKLKDMLDSEFLTFSDGRYRTKQADLPIFQNNTNLLAQIHHCFRFIRDEHVGQQKQHCAIRTNGVSRAGQIKIHNIVQDALAEIGEAITQNPGQIPVFLSALMGTFQTETTNA